VRAKKGAAGVDGLDIDQTAAQLRTTWPIIRDQLLSGTYRPMPVRRVTIPKPGGGEREPGIPTVTDRLIQQALLQLLQPILDPTFSEHSHGFRLCRSAHGGVLAAQSHVQAGFRVVVDVDLEKFFDRVNHGILMDRFRKRIGDAGVIRLIRAYLNSGIMAVGVVRERVMGTPQGGPLSPLLANVLLDDVDKELERRGHRFVRYADDSNVYVRGREAGERVMALPRRLYGKLRLMVNETKARWPACSAVSSWASEHASEGTVSGPLPEASSNARWPPGDWRRSDNKSGGGPAAPAGEACRMWWWSGCGPMF
jgi:RNA-directed DNA polymerase